MLPVTLTLAIAAGRHIPNMIKGSNRTFVSLLNDSRHFCCFYLPQILVLALLATDEAERGRGAGSLLVQWGKSCPEDLRRPLLALFSHMR